MSSSSLIISFPMKTFQSPQRRTPGFSLVVSVSLELEDVSFMGLYLSLSAAKTA